MTRQHFEAVASVINEMGDTITREQRAKMAERMADTLEQFNEQLDRRKFIDACMS